MILILFELHLVLFLTRCLIFLCIGAHEFYVLNSSSYLFLISESFCFFIWFLYVDFEC